MRLRQMPTLYLRGALANETMKGLTPEQQLVAERYTREIMTGPRLAANRAEFNRMLSLTIAGDYRENHDAADQEFAIAVWRGVVYLLYHNSYQFRCNHCQSSTYLTKRNKPAVFDRCYPSCPGCHHVELYDPGDSGLRLDPDKPTYLHKDQLQQLVLETAGKLITGRDGDRPGRPPVGRSPIVPIMGEKKVADPEAVLQDPEQTNKFFSEFIWNYFRQILNENEIKHHRKHPQLEYGFADLMAVAELRTLLQRHKLTYNYCDRTEPHDGYFHLYLDSDGIPPEFIGEYTDLLQKYHNHGVMISHDHLAIMVPNLPAPPMVEALVMRPTKVMMSESCPSIEKGQADDDLISHVEFKLVGGARQEQENPMQSIDSAEVVELIRNALPDGYCRDTYDLITGQGELYEQYLNQTDKPKLLERPGQVAKILGITPREASKYFEKIKVHMLAYGLTTASQEDDYS